MTSTSVGIAVMLLATAMTNVGAVIQKRAVDALAPLDGQPLAASVKALLRSRLWCLGWATATSAIILNMVAVGLADLGVVQPLNGFGLVVLALGSRIYLGERLDRARLVAIGLVVVGVGLVGVFATPSRVFATASELLACYTDGLGPFVLALAALFGLGAWPLARAARGRAGIVFALMAAVCSVLGLAFAKGVFGAATAWGVVATLAAWPFVVLAALLLFFAVAALGLQQLSFQKGRAVVVTPIFAGASVLLPLVLGRLVFGEALGVLGLVGPLLILAGVVVLGAQRDDTASTAATAATAVMAARATKAATATRSARGARGAGIAAAPSRYHTNDELVAACAGLAARDGGRISCEVIGTTATGRAIPAVRVRGSDCATSPARPQVLVTANLHGNEVISSEVALGVLKLLTTVPPGAAAAQLLAQADVTVVPAVNLDSRERAARALGAARIWARAPRGNARGVDLNRNFPYPRDVGDVWHPMSGTRWRRLPWYRGTAPLSEAESQALSALATRLRPSAALSLHSVGGLFLYPYCRTGAAPRHEREFMAMGAAFAAAQAERAYVVKQSHAWYTILGDFDDWLYDTFATLAATIEVARPLAGVGWHPVRLGSALWWMNPREPGSTVEHTATACLAALSAAVRARSTKLDVP